MSKKLKKIVMIGPVYPYKGGISHYTGLMYRALAKKFQVKMITYKMQYPKFLFKKEQKDYSNKSFQIENAGYLINTANPFNCVAVASRIRKMKPDLVIFQWWHPYFAPCYWLMEKFMGKKIKKMFLCHNVFPHERFPMDRLLTKLVLKQGDYFITQSSMDAKDLLSVKADAKYRQTVHPTYNAFKMKDMSKDEAREILDMSGDEKALLFFGFVREYKGLKHMINALPKVVEQVENVKLYIVGDFDGDKDVYLQMIKEKQVEDHIRIFDGYIPDDEVEKFFAASDLVVLPYESATQSGIVQIAYGFQKPVVVTNVGGLPEVVEHEKTGYVVEAFNDDQLADAVIRFFEEDKGEEFAANVANEEYKYSWDRMVEVVEDLYQA
ncbi:MAG: glycosyltransferase family 4 protein [Lachnospiraceae bacterium]|nr:glycosyltransferase family 4 protein [Lachnospiraceae bacterium]